MYCNWWFNDLNCTSNQNNHTYNPGSLSHLTPNKGKPQLWLFINVNNTNNYNETKVKTLGKSTFSSFSWKAKFRICWRSRYLNQVILKNATNQTLMKTYLLVLKVTLLKQVTITIIDIKIHRSYCHKIKQYRKRTKCIYSNKHVY